MSSSCLRRSSSDAACFISLITFTAHFLHCASSKQSPAACFSCGCSGLSFRSSHYRIKWITLWNDDEKLFRCLFLYTCKLLSSANVDGRPVIWLPSKSRVLRFTRLPIDLGSVLSRFLLRSISLMCCNLEISSFKTYFSLVNHNKYRKERQKCFSSRATMLDCCRKDLAFEFLWAPLFPWSVSSRARTSSDSASYRPRSSPSSWSSSSSLSPQSLWKSSSSSSSLLLFFSNYFYILNFIK